MLGLLRACANAVLVGSGRLRGSPSGRWQAQGAFYTAFENVEPTGKRLLLALDGWGSMQCGTVGAVPGLSPRDASAALALVTAATDSRYEVVGFFAGKSGFRKKGRSVWAGYRDGPTPLAIARGSGWSTP